MKSDEMYDKLKHTNKHIFLQIENKINGHNIDISIIIIDSFKFQAKKMERLKAYANVNG